MATFQYVKKEGGLGSLDAPDSATALRILPSDADPKSGVIEAQGGLSGTGTPAPGAAPAPSLPQGNTSGGGLNSFATALDAAVNLARQKRNASSLDIMSPYQGTVAASDFNSILNNLNAASDSTSSDLIKQATKQQETPDYKIVTNDNGDVTALNPATGEIVWSTPGVGNAAGGSAGNSILVKSGALNYSREAYAQDSSELEVSRGADGYVDPSIYQALYNAWVANGGRINDFLSQFPPDKYVNPENDWLPTYLRPKSSTVTNPFAQ